MKSIEMDLSSTESNDYIRGDRSLQFKRERRKARKVIVERLRRERIDRCLDQLKHWLQDSTLVSQTDNANLEKADILELTVSQLRHMVANTEMQCDYGYSACVQEVNEFLLGIHYDDPTRRRIVQHLCRRRPSTVPGARRRIATSRVPADDESTSGERAATAEHLRMFSYSSADSTTDGAAEPCEAGSTTTTIVNNNTETSFESELAKTTNMDTVGVCTDLGQDVESTDDAVLVSAVIDAQIKAANAAETGSHIVDDEDNLGRPLSPVWRPW